MKSTRVSFFKSPDALYTAAVKLAATAAVLRFSPPAKILPEDEFWMSARAVALASSALAAIQPLARFRH